MKKISMLLVSLFIALTMFADVKGLPDEFQGDYYCYSITFVDLVDQKVVKETSCDKKDATVFTVVKGANIARGDWTFEFVSAVFDDGMGAYNISIQEDDGSISSNFFWLGRLPNSKDYKVMIYDDVDKVLMVFKCFKK